MNRDLKIVSAAILVWALGEGLYRPLTPLYVAELGAGPERIGLLLILHAAMLGYLLILLNRGGVGWLALALFFCSPAAGLWGSSWMPSRPGSSKQASWAWPMP